MRIVGIDPGLRLTGFACLEARDGEVLPRIVEAGVFRLSRGQRPPPVSARLVELERDLCELLDRVSPSAVAVEGLFSHYRHPATAVVMGHARGVILLAIERAGLELVELKPKEVKVAMTGSGAAGKAQMQQAVASVFGLAEPPEPPDVADAIAIALAGHRRLLEPA